MVTNIYDLVGPEFLTVFALAELIAFGVAKLAQTCVLSYAENLVEKPELDVYDLAYLNGGDKHVFLTALAALEKSNKIKIDFQQRRVKLNEKVAEDAHLVERIVANAIWRDECLIARVYSDVGATLEKLRERLNPVGLVTSIGQETLAKILPVQILLLPVLFMALPKYFVGLSHHKPVGFLGAIIVFSVISGAYFLCRKTHRTAEGERRLASEMHEQAALGSNFKHNPDNLAAADLTMAYALFAMPALSLLREPPPQGIATSSSGSDGGVNFNVWTYSDPHPFAGSCGGGGCGGGGCGGCGGCGG